MRCILAWAVLGAFPAAAELFSTSTSRLGIGYTLYEGDPGVSLTDATRGFSVEASTSRGNDVFALFGTVRFGYGTGSGSYQDGATPRNLNLALFTTEAKVGIRLFPFSLVSLPIRPYVSSGGGMTYARLTFSGANLSALRSPDSGFLFSYHYGAGVEFSFGARGSGMSGSNKGMSFFIEAQKQTTRGALAGRSGFSLDGLTLLGGIAW